MWRVKMFGTPVVKPSKYPHLKKYHRIMTNPFEVDSIPRTQWMVLSLICEDWRCLRPQLSSALNLPIVCTNPPTHTVAPHAMAANTFSELCHVPRKGGLGPRALNSGDIEWRCAACVAVRYSVLQCVAVCCSLLQSVVVSYTKHILNGDALRWRLPPTFCTSQLYSDCVWSLE
jgi:hypothetical protein